jgi:hypothetical protein
MLASAGQIEADTLKPKAAAAAFAEWLYQLRSQAAALGNFRNSKL